MTLGKYTFRIEWRGRLMTVSVAAHTDVEVMEILAREYPGYRGIVE